MQVGAEVAELYHGIVVYRNTVFSSVFLCKNLFFSMRIDLFLTFCLRALTKSLKVIGEVFLDGFRISEEGGIDRDEAMADSGFILEGAALILVHAV